MRSEDFMIRAYVPEADTMTFAQALHLAVKRDRQAAKELAESAETQLRLEEAAELCNLTLREAFEKRKQKVLSELGFD